MDFLYLGLKIGLFLAVLRAFIKFEPLQDHFLFLAALYMGVLSGLSWVFLIAPQLGPGRVIEWRSWEMRLVTQILLKTQAAPDVIGWRAWQLWLVETFLLMSIYLRMLARFDEGSLFWIILLLGFGLILF